jgi:adenylosuccinate lyase
MIDRYTLPEMAEVWSPERKFEYWLKIEILACEAMSEMGLVPKGAVETIRKKASFNVARIDELEKITRHDVNAFLDNVAEYVGEEARYLHIGLTSSDVVDTALSLQIQEASRIIRDDIDRLLVVLREKAYEFKDLPAVGRSHGIHAEPITFGLKYAVWYTEMVRNRDRFERAVESMRVGKISGAVGTFANVDPRVEEYVCQRLGLTPAPVSTQILQRDRHAEYLTALSLIGGTIEKIATEIRHLQRTEVLEAEESFGKGQKGSSAMPHKRNPVVCEQLCGLARVVRSNAFAALSEMALWHERDISHSSVERIVFPDGTILIDYMLRKIAQVAGGLTVYPENMRRNLELTGGLIFSQRVLLELVKRGVSRQEAYEWVQRNAMRSWESGADFKTLLMEDADIRSRLGKETVEAVFDLNYHFKHVNTIFHRVFGDPK